jgi:hypothetical protein
MECQNPTRRAEKVIQTYRPDKLVSKLEIISYDNRVSTSERERAKVWCTSRGSNDTKCIGFIAVIMSEQVGHDIKSTMEIFKHIG